MNATDIIVGPGVFFITSLFFAMLPKLTTRVSNKKNYIYYLLAFTNGIFLYSLFADFVPSAMGLGCSSCSGHNHKGEHGHTHDHGHEHKGGHGHTHTVNYNEYVQGKKWTKGLHVAAITFLGLFAIENLFVHNDSHDHDHSHHHHKGEAHSCVDGIKSKKSKISACVFLLAISLHSFFEGLGAPEMKLGEEFFSTISAILPLFVHKIFESLSLGITLATGVDYGSFTYVLLFIYSVFTPLGMCLRVIITNSHFKSYEYICNGLGLGSTLFILFFEMIPQAFAGKHGKQLKMILFGTGYVVPSVLNYCLKRK